MRFLRKTGSYMIQPETGRKTKHCSGTVVANTSWPTPARASARAKGLFQSANVWYLNMTTMTMENHRYLTCKTSKKNRPRFSIANCVKFPESFLSADLPSLSFQETAGFGPPHFLFWKQNHLMQLQYMVTS